MNKTYTRTDTSLVLCLAVLLITNSHFDNLYPDPRLGTGGALGNTLFFLLSGYGLALSLDSGRASQENFLNYWLRRLGRVYPVLWGVTLATVLLNGEWSKMTFMDWFYKIIWPEQYWFLCAIVVFYALFYWFGRLTGKSLLISIMLLGVPYFAWYFSLLDLHQWSIENGYFKWIFYFQIMLLGARLSKQTSQTKPVVDGARLIICVVAFFGLKLWLNTTQLWPLQFLLQLILFPFSLFAFRLLTAQKVVQFIRSIGFYRAAVFLAGLTLEIYLVQVPLVPVIEQLNLKFPLSWFTAILTIPVLAYLANKFTNHLIGIIKFGKS